MGKPDLDNLFFYPFDLSPGSSNFDQSKMQLSKVLDRYSMLFGESRWPPQIFFARNKFFLRYNSTLYLAQDLLFCFKDPYPGLLDKVLLPHLSTYYLHRSLLFLYKSVYLEHCDT
jgi:hypothetical protein